MTWFGKALVLLNLALSFMLMIIGLVLFLFRTDWSNQKGKEGKPDGELLQRHTQLKELWDLLPPSEYAWRKGREALTLQEEGTPPERKDGRLANRFFYDTEIQHLLTGADKDKPARAIVLDAQRRPTPDDANFGRPKMVPATDRNGKPLLSLVAYEKEEKAFFLAYAKEQQRLEEATKEDTRLTTLFLDAKGLQQRLKDERARREQLMEEQDLVRRPLINTYVEAELLLKRKRELEYRLEELQKARAAQLAGLGRQ